MRRRFVFLFVLVGLLWALFGASFVGATEPDGRRQGSTTGGQFVSEAYIWYGDSSLYSALAVSYTIDVSNTGDVNARWECTTGPGGTTRYLGATILSTTGMSYTAAYTNNAYAAQLKRTLAGGDTRCAYHVWSNQAASAGSGFRISNATVYYWNQTFSGGVGTNPTPVPGATTAPSAMASASAAAPSPSGSAAPVNTLHLVDGVPTSWWTAPADGFVLIQTIERKVTWAGTSSWVLYWRVSTGNRAALAEWTSPWPSTSGPGQALWSSPAAVPSGWNPNWEHVGVWRPPYQTGVGATGSMPVVAGGVYELSPLFVYAGYGATVTFTFTTETPDGDPYPGASPSPSPSTTPSPSPPPLDSDGDGYSDQVEAGAGTNPNSAASYPGSATPPPGAGYQHPTFGPPPSRSPFRGSSEGLDDPAPPPPNRTGIAACDVDDGTYSKVGQAPLQPLRDTSFPGSINPLDYIPPIGNMLANVPVVVANAGQTMVNTGVDFMIPGACLPTVIDTRITAIRALPPFTLFDEVTTSMTAGSAGSASLGAIPLPGGHSVAVPMGSLAAAAPTVRPVLVAIVWFATALTCMSMIAGTFGVKGPGDGS